MVTNCVREQIGMVMNWYGDELSRGKLSRVKTSFGTKSRVTMGSVMKSRHTNIHKATCMDKDIIILQSTIKKKGCGKQKQLMSPRTNVYVMYKVCMIVFWSLDDRLPTNREK